MMYIIFSFSSQDGAASSKLSYGVSFDLVSAVDRTLDLELTPKQINRCINRIHYYVRKLAHITEYFLLAVSISIPIYVYGIRGIWIVLTSGILCIGFAALDELHQFFVAGRGAAVKDVFIDSFGSLLGILFVRTFGYIARKCIAEPLAARRQHF
ncbi:MAG: VanZ family protein [Roseburia sp.]|nr:VanZ family protein [Roseburia sp.]